MTAGVEVKMTPSHPGDFVRTEIIAELGLSVTKAAEVLGVRRHAVGPAPCQGSAVAGDGAAHREGV